MAEGTKRIEALHGPYAGQHLDLSAADADDAVSAGWARDPFAAPSGKPIPPFDQEKHDTMLAAADKAARKLRGEDAKPDKYEKKENARELARTKAETATSEQRTSAAETPERPASNYQTRTSRPNSKE